MSTDFSLTLTHFSLWLQISKYGFSWCDYNSPNQYRSWGYLDCRAVNPSGDMRCRTLVGLQLDSNRTSKWTTLRLIWIVRLLSCGAYLPRFAIYLQGISTSLLNSIVVRTSFPSLFSWEVERQPDRFKLHNRLEITNPDIWKLLKIARVPSADAGATRYHWKPYLEYPMSST